LDKKFLFFSILRAYFWKRIEFINPVRLYPIFSLSTYDLQILDSKRRLYTRSTAGFFDPKLRSSGIDPIKLRLFPYLSSISEKESIFFIWYHKVIVKYKYFRSSFSLEAAGNGSNIGFNYSHLEKQDKESLTEVVT
jgi:hypothetical protein